MSAARDLFASRGLAPGLNDIARHAGVGVGTVYRRFAGKELLIEAAFEGSLEQLVTLAETAMQQQDPWRAYLSFVERMCEMTVADRGLREVVFSNRLGTHRFRDVGTRLSSALADIVREAQVSGALRPDVSSADMSMVALLAGQVADFAGDVEPDLWRRYAALLLAGMRCPVGEAPPELPLPVHAPNEPRLDAAARSWKPAD